MVSRHPTVLGLAFVGVGPDLGHTGFEGTTGSEG